MSTVLGDPLVTFYVLPDNFSERREARPFPWLEAAKLVEPAGAWGKPSTIVATARLPRIGHAFHIMAIIKRSAQNENIHCQQNRQRQS